MSNMQIETSEPSCGSPISTIKLERARLDFQSVKVQMTFGLLLILMTCLAAYWSTLGVGFLLDDFLHLDYVARAMRGDWHDFLQNFYGNWAGSDIMKSYRPIASLSIFIDYAIWGAQAFGFHLTNILLLFGCCLFVSLITLEITGLCGNRLGASAAIWAGLLFAVYPLHPESVSWVIGRVDLLCALFYLGSVFSYLRFRLIREEPYYWASIGMFALALLSKEMAVTLPVVIAAAEMCLWSRLNFKSAREIDISSPGNRAGYVIPYFAMLGMYATVRVGILGTAVGGYGGDSLSVFLSSWHNFLDKSTLLKILVPANEEMSVPTWIRPELIACYVGSLVMMIARIALRRAPIGPFLFLIVLIPLMVLPTFQIWHIYPNLVGSRLFFLSSAPFCMLIALAALPAVDAIGKRQAKVLTGVGLVLLVGIFSGWSVLLCRNLKPWLTAATQMSFLRTQVSALTSTVPPQKRILLLDLPRDLSGAGMLTRPQYLDIIARPPFTGADISNRMLTIEPPVGGSHEFMWPGLMQKMLQNENLQAAYKWSKAEGRFIPWKGPISGSSSYEFTVDDRAIHGVAFEPTNTSVLTTDKWSVRSPQKPVVELHHGFLRVYPGSAGLNLWLPAEDLDPIRHTVAKLDLDLSSNSQRGGYLDGKVKIIWKSDGQASATVQNARGEQLVWLGRYRSWTLNGAMQRVGVRFEPGDYVADFRGLKVLPSAGIIPDLKIVDARTLRNLTVDPFDLWQQRIDDPRITALAYDASKIPGVHFVKVIISSPGTTFDAGSEGEIASELPAATPNTSFSEIARNETSGVIVLPQGTIKSSGLHQARLVALDINRRPVGLPSEPVSFVIPQGLRNGKP